MGHGTGKHMPLQLDSFVNLNSVNGSVHVWSVVQLAVADPTLKLMRNDWRSRRRPVVAPPPNVYVSPPW